MSATAAPSLDLAELRQLLRAADPAALLTPPRLLRRVLKRDRKLTNLGLRVPHARSYVISRQALLKLAERDELGVEPDRQLPPTVLLLTCPDPQQLAARPRDEVLLEYWRLLFHARVHRAVAERGLTLGTVRHRVHEIGQTEFDEIRTVLRQEKYLLPPRDDGSVYEEFAAVYLELRTFAGTLLPRYFPALEDLERIDQILAEDVDAPALFAATRLAGAPDPVFPADTSHRDEGADLEAALAETVSRTPSLEAYRDLFDRADRAAAAGNVVRAAICLTEASQVGGPEPYEQGQARAQIELGRLAERLQHALRLSDPETAAWRQALPALLPGAARGAWPAEARLLYDLQKVCVDHERPLYKSDLVEWAYSLFREPLVRPLPHQPLVLAVKHLRGAVGRLPSVRVAEGERQVLSELLHDALHRAEERLREHFRPLLDEVVREVGLHPQNFPEHVGRDKLIEELLDRISENGFLTLGDVRDALARNELKLADLSGPTELLAGDPLIRANRRLAVRAAGVYRRGEVYLRAMQRLSAVAFGTPVGRWLTLFVALPFGAAYGVLALVQELVHLAEKVLHPGYPPSHLEALPQVVTVGVLGVFFLLLLHWPAFRAAVVAGARAAGEALRYLAVDVPAAFLRLPLLRRLLASPPFLVFVRYVLKPLPLAALTGVGLWASGVDPGLSVTAACIVQGAVSLLLNSRPGRDLEEALIDWVVRKWEYFQDLLPGLYHLIMDVFRWILHQVERCLYTVDEWLRFRGGQGRATLIAKTVLGFVWFLASYAVRVFVVVFVEPWVNPIKHFPAVTVAAKLLLPVMVPMIAAFAEPFMFLSAPVAYAVAFVLVKAIPGAAGFLAWELQENWRLYQANRPPVLKPAVIGHHGETVLRLMKPGFHSGTLPKLYAKLRRAERRAHRGAPWRPVRKLREELHEVGEVLRHFGERELLAFLNGVTEPEALAREGHPLAHASGSVSWSAGPIHLAAVEAGSNRVRLDLACPALGGPPLELRFEEQSGWLLAGVARPGWLEQLPSGEKTILARAFIGFYKRAGVDLVREQIEASLPSPCPPWDVAGEGLVVWPGDGYAATVVYKLDDAPVLRPRVVEGTPAGELPALHAEQLLFSTQDVSWAAWVEAWERGQKGEEEEKPLLPGVRVLPA